MYFCTHLLLYADDLAVIAETEEELIRRLNGWKDNVESKGARTLTRINSYEYTRVSSYESKTAVVAWCKNLHHVHGNGEDWDPMGPMGFPWEWE